MGLVSWIVVGTVAGLLAKGIVPGPDPGRFVVTIILGMAGASLGGFVAGVFGGPGATVLDLRSALVAALGALTLLYLCGVIARRAA